MKKDRAQPNILQRMKKDYALRTFIFSALSFFATIAFTAYNSYLGIAYRISWNISIAIYYALLSCVRANIILFERSLSKESLDEAQSELRRKKMLLVQNIILFLTEVALVCPATIMLFQKKPLNYPSVHAITIAAYTTFKIVLSSRNVAKTKYSGNSSVKMLRKINFIDALVSVLTLQYALIMTFDGEINGKMLILCSVSSAAIWLTIVALSIRWTVQLKNLGKGAL